MNKLIKFTSITALTILLITNPNSRKYRSYASEQLKNFLKQDACRKVSSNVSNQLNNPCKVLVDTISPQLKEIIHDNTVQKNFIIFSIYQTQLPKTPLTPEYHFTTLGIFDRFFIYRTEVQD